MHANHIGVIPETGRRLQSTERVRVAAEILGTYVLARWWLVRLSFDDIVDRARRVDATPSLLDERELTLAGVRLGAAVQRTLRALPVDSRCLVTAVVLTRMLARRGIDSSLVVGVRAKPTFAAHAWVERMSVPLLPTTAEFARLTVV